MSFVHLHVHTQYSILDGFSAISKLFDRADQLGMPALAITDHGNLYGVKEFMKFAGKHPGVKPIIGCEVYVTRHYNHTLKDNDHRKYYHLILLAKNYDGYKNLMKIVSTGHIEGSYYGKPRVSHEVIEKYHENLICCSACIAGEIPRNILEGNLDGARKAIQWHKDLFGEDYYLEVQLHKTEVPGLSLELYDRQMVVNEHIFELAREMDVKVVATNDVHFVNKEDGPAHDRLICISTSTNIDDQNRMRYTQQEYLKSEEEMTELFPDHPEVLANTVEIAQKIESYKIDRDHVLPKFQIDPAFLERIDYYLDKYKEIIDEGRFDKAGNDRGEDFCRSVAFLCHLTYEGASRRYGEVLNDEQADRIDFELKTICRMGFPDYFLIVQDYIAASRKAGSMVGPGRGSAAGSVVAYCLGITNLDPIRYQLLFERFLNPDRISMPDIDVDFEDLEKAHEYVEKTYGAKLVSRVITFGTMAAKSAIKDVARVSGLSIDESVRLTRMVPDRLSEKVEKEYPYNPKLDELKPGFKAIEKDGHWFQKGMEEVDVKINLKNCYRLVPEFKEELENGSELNREVLEYAKQLEGSIRQVGMHACATIIGRGDLTEYIPICLSTDKATGRELWTSQYDGHYIEDVGMLKMDFLGLITLQIIHKCLDYIKARHGVDIDIEAIPIDDKETYELYGRGDTTSVFQFESPGMREWLQKLHPERFEDLIAMNALYRPGPMDYIPSFVARKLGNESIEYDLPQMEEFLAETYGVTVYQEQVMLLSRKLANFTKGEADKLRKAMGKKQIAVMQELKEKFMTQGMANGHPEKTLDKIWKDWEKFAQYAFNKSHATCYAWVSYQTGYLKCHYPAEFFAANLSVDISMDEIKKIMADCKAHKIKILNPDINESQSKFFVNHDGNIIFGLGGIKGFGDNITSAIIKERTENGTFADIFDFVERMGGIVNRKAFESLAYAGAFDCFKLPRAIWGATTDSGESVMDTLVRYGELYKRDSEEQMASLFGEMEEIKPVRPELPDVSKLQADTLALLHREKELVGMFLSSHPLDRFNFEMRHIVTCPLSNLSSLVGECQDKKTPMKSVRIGGVVSSTQTLLQKNGKAYSKTVLEDFDGTYELALFGKDHESFMQYLVPNNFLLIEGKIEGAWMSRDEHGNKKDVPFRFKPVEMMLMGNAAERYTKGIMLHLTSGMVNSAFNDSLERILRKHKGNMPVSMFLHVPEKNWNIELLSKNCRVTISTELFDELQALGIRCTPVDKTAASV